MLWGFLLPRELQELSFFLLEHIQVDEYPDIVLVVFSNRTFVCF